MLEDEQEDPNDVDDSFVSKLDSGEAGVKYIESDEVISCFLFLFFPFLSFLSFSFFLSFSPHNRRFNRLIHLISYYSLGSLWVHERLYRRIHGVLQ